jgi:endonuclease/exonuclease/phosphatase family metal-dependent hydrolase
MKSSIFDRGNFVPFIWAAFLVPLALFLVSGCAGKRAPAELDQPYFAEFSKRDVPFDREFQVTAFNIERGIHLNEVIAYLKEIQEEQPAMIVLLSECDRDHSRSRDKYIAREIADALDMDMVFVAEYVEYNDRTKENQATHGNAILSPFPLSEVSVIRHTPAFSWHRYGWLFGQPRKGGVVALGATVTLPSGEKIRVYSLHLESMAFGPDKRKQILDVLPETDRFDMPLVVGGDLNSNPGSVLFKATESYGIENAFSDDYTPTGWCFFPDKKNDTLRCIFKIDWILFRDLDLTDRRVHPLLADQGGRVSDHAAVHATFRLKDSR